MSPMLSSVNGDVEFELRMGFAARHRPNFRVACQDSSGCDLLSRRHLWFGVQADTIQHVSVHL